MAGIQKHATMQYIYDYHPEIRLNDNELNRK